LLHHPTSSRQLFRVRCSLCSTGAGVRGPSQGLATQLAILGYAFFLPYDHRCITPPSLLHSSVIIHLSTKHLLHLLPFCNRIIAHLCYFALHLSLTLTYLHRYCTLQVLHCTILSLPFCYCTHLWYFILLHMHIATLSNFTCSITIAHYTFFSAQRLSLHFCYCTFVLLSWKFQPFIAIASKFCALHHHHSLKIYYSFCANLSLHFCCCTFALCHIIRFYIASTIAHYNLSFVLLLFTHLLLHMLLYRVHFTSHHHCKLPPLSLSFLCGIPFTEHTLALLSPHYYHWPLHTCIRLCTQCFSFHYCTPICKFTHHCTFHHVDV
jgi:hypothetical protein